MKRQREDNLYSGSSYLPQGLLLASLSVYPIPTHHLPPSHLPVVAVTHVFLPLSSG